MTTTFTPNKQYPLQSFGANINTWGDVLNTGLISAIDKNLGGTLNKDVSGSADVTLTADEAMNLIQVISGTITANIQYIVPNRGAFYLVTNNASGAFDITFTPFEGSGFVLPVGMTILVQVDASDSSAVSATQVPPTPSGINKGKITTITHADSPYTVKATDFAINADCSGGDITVDLTGANGSWYRVKRITTVSNTLTVAGTIDDGTNYDIPSLNQAVDFQRDSSGWWTY